MPKLEPVRADLLPAADAARVRALLRDYLDQRILFYKARDEDELGPINALAAQLQKEMWSGVQCRLRVSLRVQHVVHEGHQRMGEYERTHSRVGAKGYQWLQGLKAAISPEADFSDVSSRHRMVETLARYNKGQLLARWHRGEELHEAVFRIAATFPLRYLKHKSYMIPGDEQFGFDPNAFVQRLIKETGISHVWEPVRTKVAEGGRCFVTMRIPTRVPTSPIGMA